jgi:hypothetical protein
MNRKDFQALAGLRLREAQMLFRSREFSGAYYLAGYSIECALKACITKQFRRHEFPDKQRVIDSYTHDLKKLAALCGFNQAILDLAATDEQFNRNWNLIIRWSEQSRYQTFDKSATRMYLDAIMEENSGVLPWIKQRW